MNALDWIKAQTDAAKTALQGEISRFNNRKFMQAAVAGAVAIAAADGSIDADEKRKLYSVFQNLDALKAFRWDTVQPLFDELSGKYGFDPEIGQSEALKYVGALRSDASAARQLVRICVMVGGADGSFDDKEKAVARRICRELGLEPAEFDL